jgi:hypothetical protein
MDDELTAAATALRARRAEAPDPLDARCTARLAAVVADPTGDAWLREAGLLDVDMCGYPVTGSLHDVRSEVASAPGLDSSGREQILARLRQDWADDYVLTGRARLDRRWQAYVPGAGATPVA